MIDKLVKSQEGRFIRGRRGCRHKGDGDVRVIADSLECGHHDWGDALDFPVVSVGLKLACLRDRDRTNGRNPSCLVIGRYKQPC